MSSANTGPAARLRATFLGAAEAVTGSCTLLQTAQGPVLVDCGMHQGAHEPDDPKRLTFAPRKIRALLLTHAHLDHSGLLPWLCAHGFAGPVFATAGTRDLCQILLTDSAKLQEEEAAYDLRRGKTRRAPLYTQADVEAAMRYFVALDYHWPFEAIPGLTAEFYDAGHILGAASLHLRFGNRQVVFSGDIGTRGRPLLRDPQPPPHAHSVVTEATYGDRRQPPIEQAVEDLAGALRRVYDRGGVAVIPSFAVGRTQTLLYELGQMMREDVLPRVPVFLDSPLAIEACAVFRRHRDYFDQATHTLLAQGFDPLSFPGLEFSRTVQQSKALNELAQPAVIIAGSGMCTGGRVRHHLRRRLPHRQDAVILVGYQAHGTLGRILSDGAERVKLYGDWVPVRAEVRSVQGFSAHADQQGLLHWLEAVDGVEQVVINHAEAEVAAAYADFLAQHTSHTPQVARQYGTYDL